MATVPFEYPLVFFQTRHLARTAQFYEETLGLTLVREQENCRIYRVGTGYIGFCQRDTAPAEPQGVILTLVTQNVDGWYERLRGVGVPFDQPPEHNPTYQIYHCFFRDPNGYLLEIQRFDTALDE